MAEAGVLAGRRVLVAEDELMVSMLIEDILTENGCVIVGPFTNVREAQAAADSRDIDVAVLDVNLRGDKIYPVAETLSGRGIPFFLLSGYGRDAVPPDRPAWKACSKPFKADDLIRMLLAALPRR
jgi:DNA-binding NtrC family response regulator